MTEPLKEQEKIQLHAASDLEYVYRDIFNVYFGATEVVIELGNRHRSAPDQGTISNRIVLSITNAHRLQQVLQQGIQAAHSKLQEEITKMKAEKAD